MLKLTIKERKELFDSVAEKADNCCEVVENGQRCWSNYLFEVHHIFKRGSVEMEETLIGLCFWHHRGLYGVHGKWGHALDLELKQQAQWKLRDKGFSDAEIRKMCKGKLYI